MLGTQARASALGMGIAMLAATAAHATPLNGTFNISVYQGNGSGNINDPQEQAAQGNPLIAPASLIGAGTYIGDLDFTANTNTIGAFFTSGGGVVGGGLVTIANTALSNPTFALTTVFVITGTATQILGGTIDHDDGMSLYDGPGFSNLVAGSPLPTVAIPTAYTGLFGPFQLIYVEANGLPAVLDFDVTSRRDPAPPDGTPIPGAAGLMGSVAIGGGFGAWRRRRKNANAAA